MRRVIEFVRDWTSHDDATPSDGDMMRRLIDVIPQFVIIVYALAARMSQSVATRACMTAAAARRYSTIHEIAYSHT